MRRLGLLVNPVAGMGGKVGLKGTDRPDEARARGAVPVSEERAVRFLRALRGDWAVYTVGGAMGESACEKADASAVVVSTPAEPTSGADTAEAAKALTESGVDVLVFVGGDGTAADVLAGLRQVSARPAGRALETFADLGPPAEAGGPPVLGVPSGVKMYSAVFAETPERAAVVVDTFDHVGVADVLDIDEEAFRRGELRVALKGSMRVPSHKAVQAGKLAGEDDEVEQVSLADAAAERVVEGATWILGAGTTMHAVKRALGVDGTLLGVDAVRREGDSVRLVAQDASERDLLALAGPLRLMVSPIGAQGFILGRGNLQVSAEVVRRVSPEGVLVVATPTKLATTRTLHVDSGDAALDGAFPTFVRVLTGHHGTRIVRID